jgi:hypothetical protein
VESLVVYRGKAYEALFEVFDDTTHQPTDLTGRTYRSAFNDSPQTFFLCQTKAQIPALAVNQIKLSLTDVQTALLLLENYDCDMEETVGSLVTIVFEFSVELHVPITV